MKAALVKVTLVLFLSTFLVTNISYAQNSVAFQSRVTAITTPKELPKSNSEWKSSEIYSELKNRAKIVEKPEQMNFSLGVIQSSKEKFDKSKWPASLANPYAEMTPDKDPTCKRTKCTCTTNDDGKQKCVCDYSCS